jgi:hypothetical protein
MAQMHLNIWWFVFCISLAGNVYGWAITLLRMFQNTDGFFPKMCLIAQLFIPVGFVLAFIFGWYHGTSDKHRRVMWIWSVSILLFGTLALWEPS